MQIDRATADELFQFLSQLYDLQRAQQTSGYLDEHSQPAVIRHQINVFSWYAGQLPDNAAVLDWGCHHGPDSCLLRRAFGEQIDLHACDPSPEEAFPVFRDFARPTFRQLTDLVQLPYPNTKFDAVIGSGVLEHVVMDYESLKEIQRILKPEGLLFISYLPYALSWSEWHRRAICGEGAHRRLYGKREFSQLLKRAGLYPEELSFHTYLPDRFATGFVKRAKAHLSRRLSPRFRHATMYAMARKVVSM